MSTRYFASAAVLLVCLSMVHCKAAKKAISDRLAPAASSAARAPAPDRPATEAEAALFAKKLDETLRAGGDLSSLLDTDAMIQRGFADLDLPEEAAKSAADSASKKFAEPLRQALQSGGSYKLLASRMVGSERRVKFRLLHGEGSFNYHDFVVVGRGGKPKAVDIHVIITDELVSSMLRRTLLPVAVEMKKGLVERLTTQESTYVKHLPTILKMSQFQSDPRGALAAYQSLPDVLKTDKNALTFRIQAASLVDDATYLAAMEDFRRALPNDSSLRVMLIDYYYVKKMHKEAMEQVTALEQAQGPDAHLNTLRAGVLYELEQIEPAREELRKALALEPDLAEAVSLAIALDLAASDESAALEKIRNARQLKVDLKAVEVNPAYVAFMARPDTRKKLGEPARK